jgi:hypothetical protein
VSRSRTQRWVLSLVSIFPQMAGKRLLTLYNGINRAALLAKTAVDALCHIDVVARSPPAAVHALLRLDCDGLRRADGLAQLASNAALLACGVPSESVFAAEAG